MESYLQECKHNLRNADEATPITIVLGNESCDLDSAVSSIVFAFFLCQRQSSQVVVPILNVARKELALRTEVVFFLEQTSLSVQQFLCLDDVDLQDLSRRENVNVVLVDHNALSHKQAFLEPKVTRIIDHHTVDDPKRIKDIEANISPLGSCCTLVAEEIMQEAPELMEPQVALLLYGTILLDTVCLSESAARATQRDWSVVTALEEGILSGANRIEIYQALHDAKFNVAALSNDQLLEKDVKYVSQDSTTIAIASLPCLLQTLLQKEDFVASLKAMAASKSVSTVVLMGIKVSENNSVKRQLAIYDTRPKELEKLSQYLLSLQDPTLGLQPLPLGVDSVILFEQENSTLSRKFVLPAVQKYLQSGPSLNIEPDFNFNTVEPEGEKCRVPLEYPAESIDFPDSPQHSRLLGINLEMESIYSNHTAFMEPDELTPSGGGGGGTLRRISVPRDVLSAAQPIPPLEFDNHSLSSLSDAISQSDDIIIDDDDDDFRDSEVESPCSEPIPELSAAEEIAESRWWKACTLAGEERRIDMKAIHPFKKVLSHGGYDGHSAIIVFTACYLPDRRRKDYNYIMDNLFMYVITTLEEIVSEEYVLVYLHGATAKSTMPSFSWLKRCYQMIDRRLRKSLKGLYLVHPTFWLKTIVVMTRPFISAKFSRKLRFVETLRELSTFVPLDPVCIPDAVRRFDVEKNLSEYLKSQSILAEQLYSTCVRSVMQRRN